MVRHKLHDCRTKEVFMLFSPWTCCCLTKVSMGNTAMTLALTGQRKPCDQQVEFHRPELTPPPIYTQFIQHVNIFTPMVCCNWGQYNYIPGHKTEILHSNFIVCPPITPSLCWWKVEVDGVRSVQGGKREECRVALFGNVVFSFLLCQASEEPWLPFH